MAHTFAGMLTTVTASVMALNVPVGDLDGWTALSYRNIPANSVSVSDGALHIAVDRSSSPLVYKLDSPVLVTALRVEARWRGALNLPEDAVQGERGADDFVLKVGLVEAGDTTLNWLQRRVAADWVKKLFALAPEGSGVSRIRFLSTTQQEEALGSQRTHPLNDLLHETRIRYLDGPGAFELSLDFDEPVETLGLWISADGDDTGSRFDLYIERISLHTR